MTRRLIFLNVIVFFLQIFFWIFGKLGIAVPNGFEQFFGLSLNGIASLKIWQLLTYGWLHSCPWPLHILVNLLMLRFLGNILEGLLGGKVFLRLYIGSVLASGIFWLLASSGQPGSIPLIGASGGVFGLLAAYATLRPQYPIRAYLFFVIPINTTIKKLTLWIIVIEVFFWITGFMPFIAHSAHLGGALFGFLMGSYLKKSLNQNQKSNLYPGWEYVDD